MYVMYTVCVYICVLLVQARVDRHEFSADNMHDEGSLSPHTASSKSLDVCNSEVLKASIADLVQIFQLKVGL